MDKRQSKIVSKEEETRKFESLDNEVQNRKEKMPKTKSSIKAGTIIVEPEEIPEHFLCPITYEVLTDPVIASDCHTYEKKAIENWFTRNSTSPNTGLPLANTDLLPNHVVKGMIDAFKAEQNKSFLAAKKVQ